MNDIPDQAALRAHMGAISLLAERKVLHALDRHCRAFIALSPFVVLASSDAEGRADASPRGDPLGFVQVLDDRTLLLPDRRGNNRIDSLRNILADPRVGLLFLVPGVNETLRVSGTATISTDPALIARCSAHDKAPTTVLVVRIHSVFFQCARALLRSRLWQADAQVPREALPSTGTMLAALSQNAIDGAAYDRELPERVRTTLY